jgi:hypothetical protein
MGKAFGLVLMLVALYIGMQIYAGNIESLTRRATAPIQGTQRETPLATGLTGAAGMADSVPTDRERRVWVTDVVRERVTADMTRGARRYTDE